MPYPVAIMRNLLVFGVLGACSMVPAVLAGQAPAAGSGQGGGPR